MHLISQVNSMIMSLGLKSQYVSGPSEKTHGADGGLREEARGEALRTPAFSNPSFPEPQTQLGAGFKKLGAGVGEDLGWRKLELVGTWSLHIKKQEKKRNPCTRVPNINRHNSVSAINVSVDPHLPLVRWQSFLGFKHFNNFLFYTFFSLLFYF